MKIGILTLFYKNYNYGGCLQAYALSYILNKKRNDAVQISYDIFQGHDPKLYSLCREAREKRCNPIVMTRIMINTFRLIKKKIATYPYCKNIRKREASYNLFIDRHIRHTAVVREGELEKIADDYDCFVVGSDQVWNPFYLQCSDAFFMKFAGSKPHSSYAASIGQSDLTGSEKRKYRKLLETFTKISVREERGKEILRPLCRQNIHTVIDPTLLLGREEWDDVLEEYRVEGQYIFCYFLGNRAWHRRLAEYLKEKYQMKIVSIPFGQGVYKREDIDFSSDFVWDAGPAEFLGLLKNAELVLTDSFHASVFSMIYHKNFYVVNRDKMNRISMNSRIENFIHTFHLYECFIEDEHPYNRILLDRTVDFEFADRKLEEMKLDAYQYMDSMFIQE